MAERAAASTRPLAAKLHLKPAMRALLLNAPDGLVDLGQPVERRIEGRVDFLLAFVGRRDEVLAQAPAWRAAMAPEAILWVAYPKGGARATDLNRDVLRVTLQSLGLETVSQVAIDDVWSALRLKLTG